MIDAYSQSSCIYLGHATPAHISWFQGPRGTFGMLRKSGAVVVDSGYRDSGYSTYPLHSSTENQKMEGANQLVDSGMILSSLALGFNKLGRAPMRRGPVPRSKTYDVLKQPSKYRWLGTVQRLWTLSHASPINGSITLALHLPLGYINPPTCDGPT